METLEQIALRVGAEVWPYTARNVGECEEFARRLVAALGAQEPAATLHDDGYWVFSKTAPDIGYLSQRAGWKMEVFAAPQLPQQQIPPLLYEAHDYGQFADDFEQPLAKPIRKAIRGMLAAAPEYKP